MVPRAALAAASGTVAVAPGVAYYPGFLDRAEQEGLGDDVGAILAAAPLFRPRMPRTGKAFSVRMSNCGPLGWVSDESGYRYQPTHPETGRPWPPMPPTLIDIWTRLSPGASLPEACLINFYDARAKMGLHQDRDEKALSVAVVSLSLGDAARFRLGGPNRGDPTRSLSLQSGDALVFGGPARLVFHGIDRIAPGSSTLLPGGGRFNLTLRRVAPTTA